MTSAEDEDPAALRLARALAPLVDELVWDALHTTGAELDLPGYEVDYFVVAQRVRAELPVLRDEEEFARLAVLTRDHRSRALNRLINDVIGGFDRQDPAALLLVRWRDKFRDERLTPFLRDEFTVARNALYGTDFHLFGDSRADGDSFAPTSSFADLLKAADRVTNAGGGSIGLAGSRGAGKTSAMHAYLSRRLRKRGESRELTVHLSAPTQYDAREFMLHLQATLCRKVLASRSRSPQGGGRRADLSWLLRLVGYLLVIGSLLLPVFFDDRLRSYLMSPEPRRDAWMIVGIVVCAYFVAGLAGELLRGLRLIARPVVDFVARQDPGIRRLRKEAEHLLRQARYLHTQTSGWSGKIPLPLKADVGWTRSRQYARQPLTYPEVVHELRLFIARCAQVHGTVVIGIDELDKISSPQQAEAFINELKGIFGVADCLFVVTVSEDALAAFERRGVSVRDAFDSAFDEIVRVDHLDLAESTGILNTRLPGLPVVFQALCHCLSGGLPRELVRVARHVAEFEGRAVTLRTVCSELVRSDLAARSHGIRVAAARLGAEQDVSDFLHELLRLPDAPDLVRTARRMLPKESGSYTALDRLRWEAAALCYFFATVLEVFTDDLSEDRIKAAAGHQGDEGEIEHLPRPGSGWGTELAIARNTPAKERVEMAGGGSLGGVAAASDAVAEDRAAVGESAVVRDVAAEDQPKDTVDGRLSEPAIASGALSEDPGKPSFGELAAARNALAEDPQVAAVLLGRFRAAWGLEG